MKRLIALLALASPAFAATTHTEGPWFLQGTFPQVQATSLEDCKEKWKALPLPTKQRTVYCAQQLVTKVEPDPVPVPPDPVPEPPKGKPTASNTGPKPGTVYKKLGAVNVTIAGTVLENFEASGVTVNAPNVTIRNCRISGGGLYGIRPQSSGTLIENCEITGSGSAGIYGKGFTARRVYIHDMPKDAIKAQTDVVVEDSYITRLGYEAGSHSDGVQVVSGGRIIIRRNNFDMPKSQSGFSNSQCMLFKNDSGPINDVLVEGNWLNGGGFCVQSRTGANGTPTNVRIIGNFFGTGYQFGPWSFDGSVKACGNTWQADGKLMAQNKAC